MALKFCIQNTGLSIHRLNSFCHIGDQPLFDGMDMSGWASHRKNHISGADGIRVSKFHSFHPVYGLLFNIGDLCADDRHFCRGILRF